MAEKAGQKRVEGESTNQNHIYSLIEIVEIVMNTKEKFLINYELGNNI